jgi:hypothetical protein
MTPSKSLALAVWLRGREAIAEEAAERHSTDWL